MVVRCPGAVLMPWASKVKAIIVQFLPGEQAGHALAAVLTGDAEPGGRLPVSFPAVEEQSWLKSAAQYPGLKQPGSGQPQYIATYSEGLEMGYRWFDAAKETPAFAFGSGIGFTTFSVTCPTSGVSSAGVSCTVTNTGSRAGSTVVQLYLSFPESAVSAPMQTSNVQCLPCPTPLPCRQSCCLLPCLSFVRRHDVHAVLTCGLPCRG